MAGRVVSVFAEDRIVAVPAETRIVAAPAQSFAPLLARRYQVGGRLALAIAAVGRARVTPPGRGRVALAISATARPSVIRAGRGRSTIAITATSQPTIEAYASIAYALVTTRTGAFVVDRNNFGVRLR